MNKISLIISAVIGIPLSLNAAHPHFEAKPQLVIALQDNHPTTGTDSGTTSHPNEGLNTTPTKDTGTETYSNESPIPQPNENSVIITAPPPTHTRDIPD